MHEFSTGIKRNILRRLYSKVYMNQRIDYEYTGRFWETRQSYGGKTYKVFIKLYKYTIIPGGLLARKKVRYIFNIEFYDIATAFSSVRYTASVPLMTPFFLTITTIPFRIALTAALSNAIL